jgi:hypothetical protein
VGGGHHLHRRLELLEAVLGDQGGHVGGHAAARVVLVDHHQPARLLHRLVDAVLVQGAGGAEVKDLAVDPVGGQPLGRLLGHADHPADGHDRDVVALPGQVGLAEGMV